MERLRSDWGQAANLCVSKSQSSVASEAGTNQNPPNDFSTCIFAPDGHFGREVGYAPPWVPTRSPRTLEHLDRNPVIVLRIHPQVMEQDQAPRPVAAAELPDIVRHLSPERVSHKVEVQL